MRNTQSGVAPADLIRQDFRALDARETLRTTWQIEEAILIQSVQGRAHEGHGLFHGRRYPNTTCDDVTRALRLDPSALRESRQDLIDSIVGYVHRTLDGTAPVALLDDEDRPLLGISFLRWLRVAPADVLRGLYMGGLRDDSDVRASVEQTRGIRIGGGRGYYVDYRRMLEMDMNADDLARGEWGTEIERLQRDGVIVTADRRNEQGIVYQYIRHRRGPGASDDAAVVAAGMVWGLGVAVGVFFADAVDTLEKYVPEPRDQDEEIALTIESEMHDLGIGRDEVAKLTYLAAVPEDGRDDIPDSSLRHLLAIDRHVDMCPLEAHLLAVQGIPAPDIGLGHERTPSARFYEWVRHRVETYHA